jgi:hypothetical protein
MQKSSITFGYLPPSPGEHIMRVLWNKKEPMYIGPY